ncbi:membrane protein [Sphingobium lactosutens DS20]|uniref:Membrane protein n=2 Tax=Sphingobium TaxID=165695 RepID=T0IZM7_9SPHN|nr:membrane protein [Sphingobium lactosutens DS20]
MTFLHSPAQKTQPRDDQGHGVIGCIGYSARQMTSKQAQGAHDALIGTGAVMLSLVSMNLGAAFAKTLFPLVGAPGVAGLRIVLAALLLLSFRRPWRRAVPRGLRWPLLAYGATLALMNLSIYQAFARIPLGTAIAIEVTGPLAIVLFGSRRPRDFVWLAAAVAGLLILLPIRADARLDPIGVAFACGAALCWALYILAGKRVSAGIGGDAVAWGMLVAAFIISPVAAGALDSAVHSPHLLLVALAVAFLSSAFPYTLEMDAMRRLSAPAFGLLLSSAPAIGALAGFVVLGERLTPIQWIAMLSIMVASAGSALTAAPRPRIETTPL